MSIDIVARLKNKAFWVALIPAILLLITQVLAIFGVQIDLSTLQEQLVGVVGTVFALLAIMGIVVDPTTPGISDGDAVLAKAAKRQAKKIQRG